jgi:hypothetical protein
MTEQAKQSSSAAESSPYELVFGRSIFEEVKFPEIRAEAEARGVETEIPERFLLLGSVGLLLQELIPEGAAREEFSRIGRLLYQGYHFWLHGKQHQLLSEAEVRELVRRPPAAEVWHLTPPAPAGYLQLPRNLFWARIEEGATPEAVAGFFWTVTGAAEASDPARGADAPRRLELLLVLGLFPGRPGFSAIEIETTVDRTDPFPGNGSRAEGEDFANILPGGELQDWYGLTTELEVLKLVSRCFAELAGGEGDER